MGIALIKAEMSGIKSISKPITFSFMGDTINVKPEARTHVKAIYGPNGSGKSAVMNAFAIYSKLNLQYGYLIDSHNAANIKNLINKTTKKFHISMVFEITEDSCQYRKVVAHELEVSLNENAPYVSHEEIRLFTGTTINKDYRVILSVDNGVIKNICEAESKDLDKCFCEGITSLAGVSGAISIFSNSPFINRYTDLTKDSSGFEQTSPDSFTNILLDLFAASLSLHTYLDLEDQHAILTVEDLKRKYEDILQKYSSGIDMNFIVNEEEIPVNNYQSYQKQIHELEEFIKVFKPTLKEIRINKKTEGKIYHVQKEFVYDDYVIDEQYESSGLKKLIKIYPYLKQAAKGEIAFIDEMDVNIADFYLDKLIEYFVRYGKGQLIFTSHSLTPMSKMKGQKHGIDFINYQNHVEPWIRNGNKNPAKDYIEGRIAGIPFNEESFDFLKSLGGE